MEGRGGEARGETWGWASGVWDAERETEKRRGGVSFQSDACQALTKVLVFRGGEGRVTRIGGREGMDELGGTQISSGDYFKEVCTVPCLHFNWYQTSDVRGCNQCLSTWNSQLALGSSCGLTLGAVLTLARATSSSVGGTEQHPQQRFNLIS